MRNGLKIVQLTGAYYGWAVTRVGWLRRVSGDEWELLGARTIIRTGSPRPLGNLASHGPMKDHRLTDADEGAEDVNRILIRRSFAANEQAWLKHCPKPAGWQDE